LFTKIKRQFVKWYYHPKAFLFTILAAAVFLAWMAYGAGERVGYTLHKVPAKTTTITSTQFLANLHDNTLNGSLTVEPDHQLLFSGTDHDHVINAIVTGLSDDLSPNLLREIRAHHVAFHGQFVQKIDSLLPSKAQVATGAFVDTIGHLLFGVMSIAFLAFFAFYMKANLSAIPVFGKRFHKASDSMQSVRLADVVGMEGPKLEVQEIVNYLHNPEAFRKQGARPSKGILLYGPPGNGKTLLAKAVAGEAGVPFLEQNASSFVQLFLGAGAMGVRDLFKEARKLSKESGGCIIFIDEIDAIGTKRDAPGGVEERLQTLNALLSEMDGFVPNESIVVMAATNRIDALDPALLRPGRFDRKVYVPMPGPEARTQILARYIHQLPHCQVDPESLKGLSSGMSGADLANWVNEAAVEAARENAPNILLDHFLRSRDRILVGPKNHGVQLQGQDRQSVAWHEAGHAIVRMALQGKISRVSIIPRGAALGVTFTEPNESSIQTTQKDVLTELAVLMGGRAAEEIYTPSISSGAANDLQRASALAFEAVTTLGLGPEGIFVPQTELGKARAEKVAAQMVQRAYQEALGILRINDSPMRILQEELVKNDEADKSFLDAKVLPALSFPQQENKIRGTRLLSSGSC